jgi:cyanophycinase
LREAKLIYMLGGFTGFLGETLKGSAAWQAALEAYANGAVVAGSSAGAMVMCEFYYDPSRGQVVDGLNLVRNAIVMPHYDTFGKSWASRLLEIPRVTLIGIDEQTGMLDDGAGTWTVHGAGNVTLYRNQEIEIYEAGKTFSV